MDYDAMVMYHLSAGGSIFSGTIRINKREFLYLLRQYFCLSYFIFVKKFLFIKWLFVLIALHSGSVMAQKNMDSLSIINHLSELPNFNYGKGFGIISPDSTFRLNIRVRMQNRLLITSENNYISTVEARIRRLRLKLDGWVFTPRLSYAVELGFSPSDIKTLPGTPPNLIKDAMILYKVSPHFSLGFGQTKLPGNRERVISSGNLDLVDRSIANSIFNIDRDFGFYGYYTSHFGDHFYYALKGAVTTGEGRNWTHNTSDGLSYTGRIELLPLGKFRSKGDYIEGDLEREPKPKLSVGLSYNYNNDAVRTAGQRGREMWETKNLRSFMSDLIFKYNGLFVEAEYLQRETKDPVSVNPEDPGNTEEQLYVYAGWGMNFQAGHMLPRNFEIVGRYSGTRPNADIASMAEQFDSFILGANKYIRGHTLKLQADIGYHIVTKPDTGLKRDYFNFRFQIELGI